MRARGTPGQGLEVKRGEGLATGQLRLVEVALDAASIPFGELEFGESRQEASGGPAFGISTVGKRHPMPLEGNRSVLTACI